MAENKSQLASEIGRRIASRRNQLGLTQEQAAEKAGLTQQFFASVETGRKNIRAESIVKVSKALCISTDFLLTGQVSDIDCLHISSLLKPLSDQQFIEIEDLIRGILKFGGIEEDL